MKSLISMTALCTALAFAAPAMAQEELDTSDFSVTLAVLPECTISVADLVIDPVDLDGSTDVAVNCNTDVTVEVGLSGDLGGRELAGLGGTSIDYNLYQDAAFSTVWGDTVGTRVDFVVDGGEASAPIYAQIDDEAGTLPVGEYSDTVTATLWYTFATAED